jgi:hypothetical protein
MPLFTDIHEALPAGTTAADLARAQRADLKVQVEPSVSGASLNISPAHRGLHSLRVAGHRTLNLYEE